MTGTTSDVAKWKSGYSVVAKIADRTVTVSGKDWGLICGKATISNLTEAFVLTPEP